MAMLSNQALKVLLLVTVALQTAYALPRANFSRFGSAADDTSLPTGDDTNARVDLASPLLLFSATHTHVYVSCILCFGAAYDVYNIACTTPPKCLSPGDH